MEKVFSTEECFRLDYHVHMNDDISMYEKNWVKGSCLTTIYSNYSVDFEYIVVAS